MRIFKININKVIVWPIFLNFSLSTALLNLLSFSYSADNVLLLCKNFLKQALVGNLLICAVVDYSKQPSLPYLQTH